VLIVNHLAVLRQYKRLSSGAPSLEAASHRRQLNFASYSPFAIAGTAIVTACRYTLDPLIENGVAVKRPLG
jgi:hypothetical protein